MKSTSLLRVARSPQPCCIIPELRISLRHHCSSSSKSRTREKFEGCSLASPFSAILSAPEVDALKMRFEEPGLHIMDKKPQPGVALCMKDRPLACRESSNVAGASQRLGLPVRISTTLGFICDMATRTVCQFCSDKDHGHIDLHDSPEAERAVGLEHVVQDAILQPIPVAQYELITLLVFETVRYEVV